MICTLTMNGVEGILVVQPRVLGMASQSTGNATREELLIAVAYYGNAVRWLATSEELLIAVA